jgi:hypothetical protein
MAEIDATTGFAVVCFTKEDGALYVVPTTWLITDKECFWPPFATDERIIKAVKSRCTGSENWAKHEIRILTIEGETF